ncbi:uncharacterized protein LOC132401927 isoform X4 [Hypanus sabinus]|uniref:uncharacterized protein LOC132401927 isoform X4 n=1 Tax=Hypanus sabinus TaxID=79690 RepID=UPI0028C3DBFE|nr:uncharacterized protein LOC132401927 isoform X4 [Hypanus sabinus]
MPNLSQCATRQRQRPLGVRSPVVARDVSQPSPLLLFSRVRLGTCPERVTNHLESPALEPDYANTNGTPVTGSSLEDVRSNEHPNAYENIYQTFNDESPKITVTEM